MQSNQDTNPVATNLAVKLANAELENAKLRVALEATVKELNELKKPKDKQSAKKK